MVEFNKINVMYGHFRLQDDYDNIDLEKVDSEITRRLVAAGFDLESPRGSALRHLRNSDRGVMVSTITDDGLKIVKGETKKAIESIVMSAIQTVANSSEQAT